MAKRVDPLKAKEAKQKKIAAVGGVLLLALVGVQGPKTLKMLQGPQPVASATSTPTATTPTPGSVPETAGDGSTPAPVVVADFSSVADSDLPPDTEDGQLVTLERFSSKDPFVQQAQPQAAGGGGAEPEPADDGPSEPAPDDDSAAGGSDEGADGGFTSGGAPPAPAPTPEQPAVAAATSIAVNGVAEDVAVEASFPKDEPTFVLVSIAKDGTSVQIGIAGGQYATGGSTMTLGLGKKITLQNTADGSRYELELRSIQGFPLPKTG
jgi:hypothetical protein